MNNFEKYRELDIDGSRINLAFETDPEKYFCTPIGFKFIGSENGGIQYGFIEGFGDMVFAVNPMSAVDDNVYPLAMNFIDFLRLILTCKSTTPVEQIVWMAEEVFDEYMTDEANLFIEGGDEVLAVIREKFGIMPMDNPYSYVRQVQEAFLYSEKKIEYSDEFYEVTGRSLPDGTYGESAGFEFPPVFMTFEKNSSYTKK